MIDRACISISGHCNLKCSYCHFRNQGEEYEDMTTDQAKLIIDNVIDYAEANKVEKFKIGLVGAGEPLLKFDLLQDIVNYARRSDILTFYTITNGTLVSDPMLSFFQAEQKRIELNFSLDGYRELHDMCRKSSNGGTFDVVMDGIKRYESLFGRKPTINCTVHMKTYENRKKLFDFLKSGGFNKVCFSRMVGAYDLHLNLSTTMFDCFLSEAIDQGFVMRQNRAEVSYDCTMFGRMCGVGRTNIFYSGGNIYPCGRFVRLSDYIIGEYSTILRVVEETMGRLLTNTPNQCYYDSCVVDENRFPIGMTKSQGGYS